MKQSPMMAGGEFQIFLRRPISATYATPGRIADADPGGKPTLEAEAWAARVE